MAGESQDRALRPFGKGTGDFIIGVENRPVGWSLKTKNIFLGGDILGHVTVDIQMVGGKVGDDCRVGTAFHIQQLERTEFDHCRVMGGHFVGTGEKGGADIAAKPDGFAGLFQNFGNQGGGGGFTV